jgi:hypothetical protein
MTDMFGPDDPGEPPEGPVDFWEDRWGDAGPPDWWNEDVTIYNDYFQELTYQGVDWYNETFNSNEENLELYGIDTLDIIHQLEDQGLWDADDWEYWRENYGEQ